MKEERGKGHTLAPIEPVFREYQAESPEIISR